MREMYDISKMLGNNCCEPYLNVESNAIITSRGPLFEESCENVRSLLGL